MDLTDRQWTGKFMFCQKGKLVSELRNWWHPPEILATSTNQPSPDTYYRKRLFLWMPRRM